MAVVSLKHVAKIYPGRVTAVDDLTLDVPDGELLALVGPSGCGKTTTLRLIAGLERPTSGTVKIDGRNMAGVPPKSRHVAMVFQNAPLYPHMTAYQNMAFGLKLRGTPRSEIRRRVQRAAEILEITHLLDRRPRALSGGECQRVSLGRAIVGQPNAFLFDEPLSNLDARLRDQIRRQIRRLHARLHATMIYVTHDQNEAMSLGDRVAVIRSGRIQQVAEPATIYHHPANRFVAGLIGSPPMNLVDGELEPGGGGLLFRKGRFAVPVPEVWKTRLGPYCGGPLVLGVRPEHVKLAVAGEPDAGTRIWATVETVEPLGPEYHVYLDTGSHVFVSRMKADPRLHAGNPVELNVATEDLLFFDPRTEEAVV